MMEAHAQLGKSAVDLTGSVIPHEILYLTEIGVYECKPGIVDAVGIGVDVPVERV